MRPPAPGESLAGPLAEFPPMECFSVPEPNSPQTTAFPLPRGGAAQSRADRPDCTAICFSECAGAAHRPAFVNLLRASAEEPVPRHGLWAEGSGACLAAAVRVSNGTVRVIALRPFWA